MTPDAYAVFVAAGFGLIFGSFATAFSYRIPKKESISTGRSKCPNCGAQLGAAENIPVFSYLFLRGKCRHCGQRISIRYPLIELATCALFVGSVYKFDVSFEAVAYAAFFWVLVVLSVIDIDTKLLPDRITGPALIVGAVVLVVAAGIDDQLRLSGTAIFGAILALTIAGLEYWPEKKSDAPIGDESEEGADLPAYPMWLRLLGIVALAAWATLLAASIGSGAHSLEGAAIGPALFAGPFFGIALAYPEGMGHGDVKLALLLGMFVGYLGVPGPILVAMFLSVLCGGILGAIPRLMAGGDRKSEVPFGPFLALGSALAIFWGERILDAYLRTL
ncbi:MAG: leader peptidase (prepilin peptidase) / N-methyltransferase [Actinomycetota bacterium]|jgi:leader peptidase (prepilin peptidase)/N-methyltransferase|nr:leader peptidase (prepilin peptidase) / N-methyltransferase [Actinomycetota bacterium]